MRIDVRGVSENSGGRSSVGRALDCDSSGRGFKPHRPPHFFCKVRRFCLMTNIVLRASLDRVKLCGSGGIGRHAGFRFQCFTA